MNKYLIALVMVVLAGAGYSQRSEAAACPAVSQYLGTYVSLTGAPNGFACDIGDKTFNSFTLGFSSGFTPSPPNFTVTPLGPGQWGFNLAGLPLNSPGVLDITIGYTITCNALAPVFNCISDSHLDFNGNGTGKANVTDTICLGASTPGCATPLLLIVDRTNNIGNLFANTSYTPVHMENINKDMSVNNAVISVVNNTVTQVPEPATLALLGIGLSGLAALRRRKTSR